MHLSFLPFLGTLTALLTGNSLYILPVFFMQECEAVLEVLRQQEQDHLASVPASQRHKIKEVQVRCSTAVLA